MKPWQQGRLLTTRFTRYMKKNEKDYYEHLEKCCVYEDFTAIDEGQSRRLIAKCSSPEIAAEIIDSHNLKVMKARINALGSAKAS